MRPGSDDGVHSRDRAVFGLACLARAGSGLLEQIRTGQREAARALRRQRERIGADEAVVAVQFVGVFRAPSYEEVSLTNWLMHTPAKLVAQHLNVDESVMARWPGNSPGIMPKS